MSKTSRESSIKPRRVVAFAFSFKSTVASATHNGATKMCWIMESFHNYELSNNIRTESRNP